MRETQVRGKQGGTRWWCGVAIALLAAGSAVYAASAGKAAPELSLPDASGTTVKLSSYRGKVVLLEFWATWCGGCREELPWFMEFERGYRSRGFAVLGVSMDEDGWKVVKPFIQQSKINYRVLLGNERAAQIYGGVEALPAAFLIDRGGKIVATHVGTGAGKEGFRREIEALLK